MGIKAIEKKKRRHKAIKLANRGLKVHEIATSLNVSERTILRDIDEFKKEVVEVMNANTPEEIIGTLNNALADRVRRLWSLISDKDVPARVVVRALQAIGKEEDRIVKRFQIIGLLPTENITNLFAANEMTVIQNQNETKVINFFWGNPPEEKK